MAWLADRNTSRAYLLCLKHILTPDTLLDSFNRDKTLINRFIATSCFTNEPATTTTLIPDLYNCSASFYKERFGILICLDFLIIICDVQLIYTRTHLKDLYNVPLE